jgi:hypothetical protein
MTAQRHMQQFPTSCLCKQIRSQHTPGVGPTNNHSKRRLEVFIPDRPFLAVTKPGADPRPRQGLTVLNSPLLPHPVGP